MIRPVEVQAIFEQFLPKSMLVNPTIEEEQDFTRLAMKWITYSYPCLPFDDHALKVRDKAWDTIEKYGNTLGILVSLTLDDRIIGFFNELCEYNKEEE